MCHVGKEADPIINITQPVEEQIRASRASPRIILRSYLVPLCVPICGSCAKMKDGGSRKSVSAQDSMEDKLHKSRASPILVILQPLVAKASVHREN